MPLNWTGVLVSFFSGVVIAVLSPWHYTSIFFWLITAPTLFATGMLIGHYFPADSRT